jgi:hypothetical protein
LKLISTKIVNISLFSSFSRWGKGFHGFLTP